MSAAADTTRPMPEGSSMFLRSGGQGIQRPLANGKGASSVKGPGNKKEGSYKAYRYEERKISRKWKNTSRSN